MSWPDTAIGNHATRTATFGCQRFHDLQRFGYYSSTQLCHWPCFSSLRVLVSVLIVGDSSSGVGPHMHDLDVRPATLKCLQRLIDIRRMLYIINNHHQPLQGWRKPCIQDVRMVHTHVPSALLWHHVSIWAQNTQLHVRCDAGLSFVVARTQPALKPVAFHCRREPEVL